MFEGLDRIDWAGMQHAYGPATEVPDLLRGLTSQDEQVRAAAEDGMWGAVHHQGDVYDSTLATIPFLVALAGTSGTGQQVALDLLASYGGIDVSSLLRDGDPKPWTAEGATYVAARKAVAASRSVYLGALGSPDPHVRASAVSAALVGRPTKELAQRLLELHQRDPDDEARAMAQASLGWLSRQGVGGLSDWLRSQLTSPQPKTRLLALAEEARRGAAPDTAVLVETVHAVYDTHGPALLPPKRGRFSRQPAAVRERRADAEKHEISRLAEAVKDPSELLRRLLASADWEVAADALYPTQNHIAKLRGDHDELALLVGEQLANVPDVAARVLNWIGPAAAPAREALAAAPRSPDTIEALATLQDSRVIPSLKAALRAPAQNTGFLVARLGPEAGRTIRSDVRRALSRPSQAASGLFQAVVKLEIHDAAGDLARWLPNEFAIRALRLLGPHAASTAPQLKVLLGGEPKIAVAAARALWAVARDSSGASAVLAELASPANQHTYRDAADAAGEIGLVEVKGLLREGLEMDDPYGWSPFSAARAIWRITADADATLEVVRACWDKNEVMRLDLTKLLLEMGEASAPMHDLVRKELDEPTRFTTRRGGSSSDQVTKDLDLLAACEAVLGRAGSPSATP